MLKNKLFQIMRTIEAVFNRGYLISLLEEYFSTNPEIRITIESLDVKSVEAELTGSN